MSDLAASGDQDEQIAYRRAAVDIGGSEPESIRIHNRPVGHLKSFVRQHGRGYRHVALAIAVLMATAVGLILVGISPIALRSLSTIRGINWAKLGNVGQAYGTVSALLVVLGLSGVAITMLMQIRESRHNRVQAARSRQHDLVRMAMDEPTYMTVIAPGRDFNERRQASYVNLWIQFWLMLWEFGDLGEAELRRVLAAEIFSSTAGRRSWEQFRSIRIRDSERRRHRRFYDILDQEYEVKVASAEDRRTAVSGVVGSRRFVTVAAWTVAAAVATGILRRPLRKLWAAGPQDGES
jgi:hypothetical protein